MYGILIELCKDELLREFGDSYQVAYDELRSELQQFEFEPLADNLYINTQERGSLATVYQAVNRLTSIEWLKNCVRFVKVCKIDELSDFTEIVKGR